MANKRKDDNPQDPNKGKKQRMGPGEGEQPEAHSVGTEADDGRDPEKCQNQTDVMSGSHR